MTPETFRLLLGGPEERRRFLDWGVFHVEPSFAGLCQRYQRLLKQRNAGLRQPSTSSLQAWENELALVGELINASRERYIAPLLPFVEALLHALLPGLSLTIRFERGWQAGQSLEEALRASLRRDQGLGYTTKGPHRAELTFEQEEHNASQVLSRGQQKLLIIALQIAQSRHLASVIGKKCVYLIDDLAAELDAQNRNQLLTLLTSEGHQVFLTGVDVKGWQEQVCDRGQMFHVEHGKVVEVGLL
jgi:DNA replication and repair protein RecF